MNPLKEWQRKNRFKELVYMGDMRKTDSSDIPRVYILVRDDLLPPLHQGIQAAHAISLLSASLTGSNKPYEIAKAYIILLGADEVEMKKWLGKKKPFRVGYTDTGLVDPDNMPVMTAIAFEPMNLQEGNKLFAHLRRAE